MGQRIILVSLLLLLFNHLLVAETQTANHQDFTALKSLMDNWKNMPPSWSGSDPCYEGWEGIKCTNSRVTSIALASMGLTGHLSGDIASLSELNTLDLSYNEGLTGSLPPVIGNLKKLSNLILVGCNFTGSIPENIGSLQQLVYLALNSNRFSGKIPASIGNLSKLSWLDLSYNQLEGPIPVSSGGSPGLDKLLIAKHFHLGNNRLSGTIPPQFFSSEMTLIHALFDSNQLNGSIPSTLGLVQSLEVVRFDSNLLSGSVPPNINNLTKVSELYLSNNKLIGPLPNLSELKSLSYLDMSNNSFDPSEFPPWLTTLRNLTTLKMEKTQLTGQIPASLFSLANLQTVELKHNDLNGTLDIGTAYSKHLDLIDLQDNKIDRLNQHDNVSKIIIILVQNPICDKGGTAESYCSESIFNITYTAPPSTCLPVTCSSDQILSPTCKCAYPYTGILIFRTGYFLDNEKQGGLEKSLMDEFKVNHLPVDSVSLSNLTTDQTQYVKLSIQIFPSGQDRFNETGVISIAYLLSTQTHNQFFFIGNAYQHFGSYRPAKNRAYWGIIVLSSLGFFVFGIGVWRLHKIIRKRRIQKRKEKYFKQNGGLLLQQKLSSGQVKFDNTKLFNSKDLEKATDRFNVNRVLGKGGQGTVYKGMLVDGQIVAVKKFKVKGNVEEFINEVLILSQINHRNVVKLLGFCLETEVPLLVYEFIPNGTLSEYLHQQNEDLPMTWEKRLQIAIEVAEALFYLHSSASQPIYHRDIKSTNILLNEKYKAKVADFGTSRMVAIEDTHLTTLVQGTFGYLDPEYFHTSQFTAKSDVFSFGVVLAELLTGQKPISSERPEEAKGLASYFIMCMEENSLFDVIDKRIMEVEKGQIMAVANLAKRCLELNGRKRPTMREVTMELEGIQKYRKSSSMQQNLEKVQFFGGLDYDKLKLYSYQRSSCSSQVRIALKLKGLKYEDKTMKGEQSDPEFLKLNPIGSVPVLMDEDVVISDSFAIIMYLEEKFPQRPLLPYDIQKRVINFQAANIVSSNIQPFQNLSLQKYVEEKVSPHEKLPLLKSVITEGLTALEIILKDHAGRYATGDEIFLADLFLAPQLDAAMRFNIDMTEFPILERLNETYNEIPAFREALLWESDCINFKF